MTSDDEELKPQKSKNQQKREAEAAQALGTELVDLPASQFKALIEKLELPEKLHEALAACRSIKAREGRRRQLQFIGKLMRTIETAPIEQKLAELKRGSQVATAQLHHIERWRERTLPPLDRPERGGLRLGLHGLWVESDGETGTKFLFTVPCYNSDDTPAG